MLTAFIAAITALPAITGGITSYLTALNDAKVRMLMARTGMTRDVAVQTIQSATAERVNRDNVIAGSKLLQVIIVVMLLPVAAYEWKVVVYDNLLQLGSTPAIHGDVAAWMGLIVNWLFGSTTALVAGSMVMKTVQSLSK